MSRSDSVISVYSDARAEYTKQLCAFLVPSYFQYFLTMFDKAKEATKTEQKKLLWQFQSYLNEIPDWNMEKVNNEIQTIQTSCGCDYMEDLLTAVFIAHTKVLTAIRISAKQKKINITVPKVEHFLFKVLCECSKLLWGSTYLFREGISGLEKQQNYRNIEALLHEGVHQAIRALVPVKSILKDFVSLDESDEEQGDEEEEHGGEEDTEGSVKGSKQAEEPSQPAPIENATPSNPVISEQEDEAVTDSGEQEPEQESPSVNDNSESAAPVIVVEDEKPNVRFSEYDSVIDTENPDGSDMVFEPKNGDDSDDEFPALEILEETGTPMTENDFESLDNVQPEDSSLNNDDYDILV
jgi:hypothetical protein